MSATPEIENRAQQPYVAIRTRVPMSGLAGVGARLGEVFAWMGARGVAPAGPPFFKYNVIDMAGDLEVEGGVPIAQAVEGDTQVTSGVLPAGRYATVTHVGHPDQLLEVTRSLLAWASDQGLKWDMSPGDNGERWGSRLEFYLTDPSEEPDMNKWETQLAFRLAD
ncbi:MAG TPA: GyrI-like domain-containing protein [Streptosporangiaceae bacterium]|nr:GyrI-like domain-containing protein [Streptosporangiaceae bacterium]